jgi:hypothetical protein
MQAQRQQPGARDVQRRQLERLDFMRKMMVLDSDVLTSRRNADGRPVPRRPQSTSTPGASDAVKRNLHPGKFRHPAVFDLVIFRKSRWLAMLAGCIAVVWMAGNSLRKPASAQPVSAQPVERQAGPSRPVSPAVAAQPPQKGEFKGWFFEDSEAENNLPLF